MLGVAFRLPYGEPEQTHMDDYFLLNAQRDTGANNVVTSIVFDYRGFDTLGEATVLFVAVVGISLILRRTHEGEEAADEE
ncbi:MAG: hypothetical protein LBN38_01695 [Verrucomicrobiota bacterium]|nr:hypothetical protein [Verrucomicrobiota bacterium]